MFYTSWFCVGVCVCVCVKLINQKQFDNRSILIVCLSSSIIVEKLWLKMTPEKNGWNFITFFFLFDNQKDDCFFCLFVLQFILIHRTFFVHSQLVQLETNKQTNKKINIYHHWLVFSHTHTIASTSVIAKKNEKFKTHTNLNRCFTWIFFLINQMKNWFQFSPLNFMWIANTKFFFFFWLFFTHFSIY